MRRREAKKYAEARARYWARRAEIARSEGTDNDVRFALLVSEAYRRAGEAVDGADPKAALKALIDEAVANSAEGLTDMPLAKVVAAVAVFVEVKAVLTGGAK